MSVYFNIENTWFKRAFLGGAHFLFVLFCALSPAGVRAEFAVPDTGQVKCYDHSVEITCPDEGEDFYGQDAQFDGPQPSFTDNGDGTVTDNITNLTWQQTTDANGDGDINVEDKMNHEAAVAFCQDLVLAGQTDWRLPTITELYSLIDFSGTDVSSMSEVSGDLNPFIDTDFFVFGYGDTSAGERTIDAQYASETLYVADQNMQFGVNFADGRIKGYWLSNGAGGEKTFYVQCVRGDTGYGENDFVDNGDRTVTDQATGLMWSQGDSEDGLNWEEALAWVVQKNADSYLGYSDWRLPNAKELQSIVDYTRSPDTTSSAATNSVFTSTEIINEAGQTDYGYYWTSTTHKGGPGGESADYLCFGRALGFFNGAWTDVHGAGAQRCEFKDGDPDDYPEGNGPQGDAVRIYNLVRLVRDAQTSDDGGDDGGDDEGDDSSSGDEEGGGGGGCFIGSVF